VGSIRAGFDRVSHLRPAALVGGDAAARHPVQAAAGFLDQVETPDLTRGPFDFPSEYARSQRLLERRTRIFSTTSAGRLFDAAAALVGFTRAVTFEGQAAMWLEWLARTAPEVEPYPCPALDREIDWRPLLRATVKDRMRGRDPGEISRAFHTGLASGLVEATAALCRDHGVNTAVASGGVMQNALLLERLATGLEHQGIVLLVNHLVPPNDGGVSLGQAALGALGPCTSSRSH
jgi:hydrogenase maturation protein HypF